MNGNYELHAKFKLLQDLCRLKSIPYHPEPGCSILYQGQLHYLIAADGSRAALAADFSSIPLGADDILYIERWAYDDSFIVCPTVEMLLNVIWNKSQLYPTLVPGIEAGREVWKAQHPRADSHYIFSNLRESLLELTLNLLSDRKDAG